MEDAEVLMCVGILNAEAVAAQHSVVQSSVHSGVVECMIVGQEHSLSERFYC